MRVGLLDNGDTTADSYAVARLQTPLVFVLGIPFLAPAGPEIPPSGMKPRVLSPDSDAPALMHGESRIYSGAAGFATEMLSQFAKTPLPSRRIYSFGVSLPFAEAVIGVLIFIELWSRLVYCAGFLLIIALTFGSTLRQDWTAAIWQLLYAFAYAALLAFREYNVHSVDGLRTKPVE